MKVLVSDYDKTFYTSDKDIKKNIKTVEKFVKYGNIFIIATGRSYMDFKKKVDAYQIKYDYVLLNHGATILDKFDNVLYDFPIENTNMQELRQDLEISKSLEYFCCSKLESRVDFNHENLTKIAIRYLPLVNISKIKEKIDKKYPHVNTYLVSSNMYEIISKKIDKSKAIKLLIHDLNINKNDVFTIGDSYTDLNMIKDFNGYAMKKSVKELIDVAHGEVRSVTELIERIISKNYL